MSFQQRRAVTIVALICLLATACRLGSDTTDAGQAPLPTAIAQPTITEPTGPEPTSPPAVIEPTAPGPTVPPTPVATATPLQPTPTPLVVPLAERRLTKAIASEARVHQLYWLRDGGFGVGGFLTDAAGPAAAALERLLAGPDDSEVGLGMGTSIPAGTELLGLTVRDGVAAVDLSGEFYTFSSGTTGELMLVAQVVFTLTQFDAIDSVNFVADGVSPMHIFSHGMDPNGHTRTQLYPVVTAMQNNILVESPVPGQVVDASFEVAGFSLTFESNVQYEVTAQPGGEVIASGFTTARQPDVGVHGRYDLTVVVDETEAGLAMLTVFDESPKDGARTNVYEVPVLLGSDGAGWLRVNGFGPVDFGAPASLAQNVVEHRFGPATEMESSECPGGPAVLMSYDDFTLLMSKGELAGWFYHASLPGLGTPSGVMPGLTLSELAVIYEGVTVEESTLGQEFIFEVPAGFIGGFMTDDGLAVTSLYAGTTCFFR